MSRDILRNIGTIARALDSISNIEFKDISLARGQYLYLSRIYENPDITQKQLSDLLCVDKTSTNRAISRLAEMGLVTKTDDPTNKKNKHLQATAKGAQLYSTLDRESQYSTRVALSGLDATEAAQLSQLLAKVTQNTTADWIGVKHGHHRIY